MEIIRIIIAYTFTMGLLKLVGFIFLLKVLERVFKFKIPFVEGLRLAKNLLMKVIKYVK